MLCLDDSKTEADLVCTGYTGKTNRGSGMSESRSNTSDKIVAQIAKRKSIKEMSDEEKEIQRQKWRERQRRFRFKRGLEQTAESNPLLNAALTLTDRPRRNAYATYLGLAESRRRLPSKTIRKKSIAEMSDEEKEIQRHQWRERQRFSRLKRGGQFLDEDAPDSAIALSVSSALFRGISVPFAHRLSSITKAETITPDVAVEAEVACANSRKRKVHSCEPCFQRFAVGGQVCTADLPSSSSDSTDLGTSVGSCRTDRNSSGDADDVENMRVKEEEDQNSVTYKMEISVEPPSPASSECDNSRSSDAESRLRPTEVKQELICCEKCFALCSNQEQACLTIQSLQKQMQLLEEELNVRRNGNCS